MKLALVLIAGFITGGIVTYLLPSKRARNAFTLTISIAFVASLVMMMFGCSSTQKQDTALAAMATFQAAEVTYSTWDAEHQLSIADDPSIKDAATANAKLAEYRHSPLRAKITKDAAAAADALKTAANAAFSSPTFAAFTTAAAALYADLKALGVPF